jgi:hypothetical protein
MLCIFCGTCGARLWNEPESRPDTAVIKPGTLDDTSWLDPIGDIWTRSRQRWVEIPADGPHFAEQADPARLAEAWKTRSS